jgi:hypothetical protein
VTGSGGTPAGTVTFSVDGHDQQTVTLNASGVATFTASTLALGSHAVVARYNGSGTFAASSTSLTQDVQGPSTTVLTSSANPSTINQAVTFTATVTGPGGTPGGGVSFFVDGGVPLATVSLNPSGVATFTTRALTVGSHSVTAAYFGSPAYTASLATPLLQTVNGLAARLQAVVASNSAVNTPFIILVQALNAQGLPASGLSGSPALLLVQSAPPGGALSGPTQTTFANGLAAFVMTANLEGTYLVQVTDVVDGISIHLTITVVGRPT